LGGIKKRHAGRGKAIGLNGERRAFRRRQKGDILKEREHSLRKSHLGSLWEVKLELHLSKGKRLTLTENKRAVAKHVQKKKKKQTEGATWGKIKSWTQGHLGKAGELYLGMKGKKKTPWRMKNSLWGANKCLKKKGRAAERRENARDSNG